MPDQKKPTIGFWLTCLIIMTGLLLLLVVDGNAWGTSFGMKVAGLVMAIFAGVIYVVWRGKMPKAYLVRTGLEWVYALTLLALFGAWILSADPRQGLSRISLLIGYFLLFYLLADLLEVDLDRNGVIAGLLTASGIVLMMAALETYVVYAQWWDAAGSRQVMPPYPYRLISLVGHSNAMMGLANLCAPLAFVLFLRKKKILERVLLSFWLVTYAIVIPFSSSRGGWLGIAAWIGLLFLFWLWKQNPLQKWRAMGSSGKTIAVLLGLVAIIAAGAFLFSAFTRFAQHPSHGTNVFGGRSEIWGNAFEIWLANPTFGVGPGQFGFGYIRAADSIPPRFWALHAHSLPIQILAEFGVFGGLALIALLVENLRWFWERFRLIEEENCWVGVAVMSGVAAWGVQMVVDDQSGVAVVMASLILLLAYFVSIPETPLNRWPQVSNNFIVLPGLMLAIGAGWALWAYAPLDRGNAALQSGDCLTAAPLFNVSMERDPNFSFYATQAGFAWAECGVQENDEAFLINAHRAFERSVEIEPDVSLVWANMAVVGWQAPRFHDKAIPNIQHAIALSPNEASYLLNLGWFYEQEEFHEQAVSAYVKTLAQQPDWSAHPFWQLTEVREEALSSWVEKQEKSDTGKSYWMQAREAIDAGNYSEAELLLLVSGWTGEPGLAVKTTRGMLAEAKGDRLVAIKAYDEVAQAVQRPVLNGPHQFMLTYTVWLNRRQGMTDDFVPGYVQLDRDYGQFEALQKLYTMYQEDGMCQQASTAWQTWQQAVHGGAFEALPQVPDC